MRIVAITLLAITCAAHSIAAADKPRVSFELITRTGLSPTAPQQWYQALSELGISGLRIRSGTGSDEMDIRNQGTAAAPAYRVVGILAADNVLYVPGGKFALSDVGKLRKWLDELRDQGADGVTQPRTAFGLTPRQLQEVHDDLKPAVDFSTVGMGAAAAVARIAAGLRLPLKLEPGASAALAAVQLTDELEGLSCGTALAAAARPAGLVLLPRREPGGTLEYRLGMPPAGSEAWPVGWKPEQQPREMLPELFELLNVEIQEIPVSEAVATVAGRLEVPVLYDRNAMALHGADPATTQAAVPSGRMSYSQVLGKVLLQARLKYELRLDEADKPFVWITTVKPAP